MKGASKATGSLWARASFIIPAELTLDGATVLLVVNGDIFRLSEDASGRHLGVEIERLASSNVLSELEALAVEVTPSTNDDDLSEALRARASEIERDLSDRARDVARAIRWRLGLTGNHRPLLGVSRREWSPDGAKWLPLPGRLSARVWATGHPRLEGRRKADVERLASSGPPEPVAHELLLEAEDNRASNDRSSLLLAVAALETGVKAFIADVAPEAEWLAFEAPSPPLVRMICDYLPTLPTPRGYSIGKPSKTVRKLLQSAVEARNSLAHRGETPWSGHDLDHLLSEARAFLYILDYLRGRDWAIEHLSSETLETWGLPQSAP